MRDMELEEALAKIYPEDASIHRLLVHAGVDVTRVQHADRPITAWHNALTEATAQGKIIGIIQIATSEYPHDADLANAVQIWRSRTNISIHPSELSMVLGQTIQRVERLETQVKRIWAIIAPPPRRRVALILAIATIVVWWTCVVTLWSWYLTNPVQAALINLAFPLAALFFYWLSGEDADETQ